MKRFIVVGRRCDKRSRTYANSCADMPMSSANRGRYFLRGSLLFVFCVAAFATSPIRAEDCRERATLVQTVDLYDRAPELMSGRGLVFGQRVATLSGNSEVLVCQRITIGYLKVSQQWAQVAALKPDASWLFGWVRNEDLRSAQSSSGADSRLFVGLITVAHAQEIPSLQSANTAVNSAAFTSTIPAGTSPPLIPSAPLEGRHSESAAPFQSQFLFLVALSIMLGLFAQAAGGEYDVSMTFKWKPIGRHFIRSAMFAPIVLLAFMTTSDLNAIGDWKQSLVLCLLAFQAGYLWKGAPDRIKGTEARQDRGSTGPRAA